MNNDIYHYLRTQRTDSMNEQQLRGLSNACSDTVSAMMAGLRGIGSLAFWATASNDYPPEVAHDDLRAIGEMLMYLPRIVEAIKESGDDADSTLSHRLAKENAK